MSRFSKMPYS